MFKYIYIFLLGCLLLFACKSNKGLKLKPDWVQNRPTNEIYYVGIGIASKASNPFNYQQVAKKNAVNDLISEIKVTVSSNSVLQQYQNNKEFSQQFESDVKITAMNTIEQFNVVDSWEDKDFFWIYYRLSKDEYKTAQRKKLMAAIEQAENYFERSETFSQEQFMQSIRLKVKALAALQLYLNEDVQTVHDGKNVYLINELVNSIQNQLYQVEIVSKVNVLKGKVGQSIAEPFEVSSQYRSDKIAIPFLPIVVGNEHGKIEGTLNTETDQIGIASIAISKILDKSPVQLLRVSADIKSIIKVDSLNLTLQTILTLLDVPSTTIRLNVIPIKIYIESNERNLSNPMEANYLNSALKKILAEDGCTFVETKDNADFILRMEANTHPEGIIWGNMRTAALNMSISLVERTNNVEVFKDAMRDVKGFQVTDENAGIDAYKTATQQLLNRIYPSLKNEIMRSK
jgi:hypothetical protein